MKVKELIELLKEKDPEMYVLFPVPTHRPGRNYAYELRPGEVIYTDGTPRGIGIRKYRVSKIQTPEFPFPVLGIKKKTVRIYDDY